MEILGTSKAIERIRQQAKKLARSRKGIVIIGEEGVGKSAIAQYVHSLSADAKKTMAHLNLAALDESRVKELIKSIIESREFRNPIVSTSGDFKLAKGSTLIFDESEQASPAMQQALCNLLEAAQSKNFEYRFIFLFEHDAAELSKRGKMLGCLFAHVSQFDLVEVPPFSERLEDIPVLVDYFANNVAEEMGIKNLVIDPNALEILIQHDWKRNAQELKECVERCIVFSNDEYEFRLPEEFVSEETELRRILDSIESGTAFALDTTIEAIEKKILLRVLQKFNYNQSKAARFIRITEDTLRYRMKKLGIPTVREQ